MAKEVTMKQRKGQAAMEFLMTYGWAILAAIIAIGVLAYFGVFNPSQVAGSQGQIRAPFYLDAYNVIDDGATSGFDVVNLEVTQSSGQSLNVSGIVITGTGPSSGITCDGVGVGIGTWWVSGNRTLVEVDCGSANEFASGDSFAGNIEVTYLESGSSLSQVATGDVRDTVQ